MSKHPSVLNPTPEDMSLLLAAQTHIGTKNLEKAMIPYVYKRRADGIHLINLGKTWEKLVLAARVLAAVENPADIVVISSRTYGHRAVLSSPRTRARPPLPAASPPVRSPTTSPAPSRSRA